MQRIDQAAKLPGLLSCAQMAIRDECPPETCMYLCQMEDTQECDCLSCWDKYLVYVDNGRRHDPYARDRARDE